MKLIIDIHEKDYNSVKNGHIPFCILSVFENAIPMPDNATNGDVIKAIFPNSDIEEHRTYMKIVEGDYLLPCAYQWWNAPYQKGGKT